MTTVDWIALGFIAVMALFGFRRGLIAGALSAAGVLLGAVVGARLAPHLLSGGPHSPYTPLAALAGATVLAVVLESAGAVAGSCLRAGLRIPPLRLIDSFGGLLLGAVTGAAVVWVLGAVALQLPNQTGLRRGVQRSLVLQKLNAAASPASVLNALARVDPLPDVAGPLAPIERPDPRMLRYRVVQRASASVVRVLGTACGLGVAGTGWIAAPDLVVTAAHVVAGEHDTAVEELGSTRRLRARPVAFDSRNDVAVVRVSGLHGAPLPLADPSPGSPVAILGYPGNGPFTAAPGRIGRTTAVIWNDATETHRVFRTVTTFAGVVRPGNSGSPAVDARGAVETTVFAARTTTARGYGVPADPVRRALAGARNATVSTGDCAE
jgi:uncharacterized membrane protein required for colicin V production